MNNPVFLKVNPTTEWPVFLSSRNFLPLSKIARQSLRRQFQFFATAAKRVKKKFSKTFGRGVRVTRCCAFNPGGIPLIYLTAQLSIVLWLFTNGPHSPPEFEG